MAAIIPCYNAARYVRGAVQSVLNQVYRPIEVIVVDDGSEDDLEVPLAPFAGRISITRLPHAGPAVARNAGIEATDAEFLAFLDADDIWQPFKTARQMAALRLHPECGLVYVQRAPIDESGRMLAVPLEWNAHPPPEGDCLAALAQDCQMVSSQVMVRRSVLGADRFASEVEPVEDWDLWLRLAARTRFALVDEPLTLYRKRAGSFSRNRRRTLEGAFLTLTRAVRRLPAGRPRAVALASSAHVKALLARDGQAIRGERPEERMPLR